MTVLATIGTNGRNYSTLAAWAASIPATLADAYVGQCYNDSEFASSSGTLLTLSGHTTSATNTITLTTGPGQSFADNANRQTNALTYNRANGVGISGSAAYNPVISIADANVILSKLQIRAAVDKSSVLYTQGAINFLFDGCIIDGAGSGSGYGPVLGNGSGSARNCLFVLRQNTTYGIINAAGGYLYFYNCTFVVPSDFGANAIGINSNYQSGIIENCAFFGLKYVTFGSTAFTLTTCMTDVAAPPAGCTTVAYANQFVNNTNAAGDWRLKSGATMIDAGTTDTADIPAAIDIVGTTRPQGGAWDIGCWEFVQSTARALAARGATALCLAARFTALSPGALAGSLAALSHTGTRLNAAQPGFVPAARRAALILDRPYLLTSPARGIDTLPPPRPPVVPAAVAGGGKAAAHGTAILTLTSLGSGTKVTSVRVANYGVSPIS
jgi:hypothetical protein